MRARSALFTASLSSLLAGASLVGCGSGDDNGGPVPSAEGGGGDATSADGHAEGAAGEGGGGGGGDAGDAGTATLSHIFYIMMENHGYAKIIGDTADAPSINTLATQNGLATSYFGVTHPSLPNYLAAISGDFQGVWDDCAAGPGVTCAVEEFVPGSGDGTSSVLLTSAQAANAAIVPHWFSGRNLVDQLEERGLTWVAYMEGIAGVGDTSEYWPYYAPSDAGVGTAVPGPDAGVPSKLYAQKHDPFMYFQDIRTNSNRMQKIVPFTQTQLAADLAQPSVPNFVWISPTQCNDMHGVSAANGAFLGNPDCAGSDSQVIALGDKFVNDTVKTIKSSPAWGQGQGSAIVIVWDEDDYVGNSGCCGSPTNGAAGGVLGGAKVPAIVISSRVTTPQMSSDPYNHYSLLATIQHLWGLGCLANTCGMTGSQLMTKLFVP